MARLPIRARKDNLLKVARTFVTNFVDVEEASINGFDVEEWCLEVEKALAKSWPAQLDNLDEMEDILADIENPEVERSTLAMRLRRVWLRWRAFRRIAEDDHRQRTTALANMEINYSLLAERVERLLADAAQAVVDAGDDKDLAADRTAEYEYLRETFAGYTDADGMEVVPLPTTVVNYVVTHSHQYGDTVQLVASTNPLEKVHPEILADYLGLDLELAKNESLGVSSVLPDATHIVSDADYAKLMEDSQRFAQDDTPA